MIQRAVSVQRTEASGAAMQGPGAKGSQNDGLRSKLRGVGYDEGASLLSPVQQKADAEAAPQPTSGGSLDGRFIVQGSWDSFGEWHLAFQGGELVDSHTDDLGAADWPTQMSRSGDRIVLTQTTEGSDATLTEELVLVVVQQPGGAVGLEAVSATSIFADHTGDGKDVSRRSQGPLPVITVS